MTEENANILKDNVDALVKKIYQKGEGVEKSLEEAVILNGMCEGLAMEEERNPILKFLTYKIIDGEVAITDCSASASGTLEIPATIDGYPVTSIGDWAFEDCSNLTSVTIPSSVTSIGERAFAGCSSLRSVTIPSSVTSIGNSAFVGCSGLTSVTIPSSVTSIGYHAFEGCRSLRSVTIPASATSIGRSAFYGCSNLYKDVNGVQYESEEKVVLIRVPTSIKEDFTIPNSVRFIHSHAFSGCISLTSVTIPEGVTSIGQSAFYGCTSLTSVTIPKGVTKIGWYAFYGCSALTSVTFEGVPPTVESDAFDYVALGCKGYYLPMYATAWKAVISNGMWKGLAMEEECTPILKLLRYKIINGEVAITDCSASASGTLEIPATIDDYPVTSIGRHAFMDCTSLRSVTIPSSVTSIGKRAFSGCSNLYKDVNGAQYESEAKAVLIRVPTSIKEDFTIPNSVRFIHSHAFMECTALTSVTIPEGVKTIGANAFRNCSSLTSVTIPEGVTSIGDFAFEFCTSLTSVTISSSVTSIGERAFYNCTKLTSVTIPPSVTSIGQHVFCYCSNLTSVTIPEGVTSIGERAFAYCRSLTSITIPLSVTSIGVCAFSDCSGLKSVTFEGVPPEVGSGAFFGVASRCKGFYLPPYAAAWEAVIVNGKWDVFTMEEVAILNTPTFAVHATVVGDGEVQGLGAYQAGTQVTLTAVPGDGFVFCGWSESSVKSATYTFTMPNEPVEVIAYFASVTALEKYITVNNLISKDEAK